jgi:uncharacterized phage protein gp47/JayE
MTFMMKSYEEMVNSILDQIIGSIVKERHDYTIAQTKYRLSYPKVQQIISINGTLNGDQHHLFEKDEKLGYRLDGNMLEWLEEGQHPDDNTPFFVTYRLREPVQGIADRNPGSIIRTITEAIALEMDFLYAQMNQVYNSAFIDTATGKSLDLVVALLGIIRMPAVPAKGEVIFEGKEKITIPVGTKVSTSPKGSDSPKVFKTTQPADLVEVSDNKWEAKVPVEALTPGKEGNTSKTTINLMPKVVTGINEVYNDSDIQGGSDAEGDSELRDRAKRALEAAGKGTLYSLKAAVESIPGVGKVKIIESEETHGLVQIYVLESQIDKKDDITNAIEKTRSAGIKVELHFAKALELDIKLTIVISKGLNNDAIKQKVKDVIGQYMDGLVIDEDIKISRITKSAYSIEEVNSVKKVTINAKEEDKKVGLNEKGELKNLDINVEVEEE